MTAAARKTTARKTAPRKAVRAVPYKPEGVKEPQDHLDSAAKREAAGEEYAPVEWDGLEFQVLADPDDWNAWTVLDPLSSGNIPRAVVGLLGQEQSIELRKLRPNMTALQMRQLFDAISKAVGFGNSGN
jgi:hypothetical protein